MARSHNKTIPKIRTSSSVEADSFDNQFFFANEIPSPETEWFAIQVRSEFAVLEHDAPSALVRFEEPT
ncbi:hypothetical protein NIES2104_17900 [Leptolyngbya sp. NIES-2104]|nr:hypothetical protein NIES2104_17900 [Leptolyngbya sp. NIES-2104]